MRGRLWLVLASWLLACAAARGETRYTLLVEGREVGAQISNREADGELDVAFEYELRGYGPKLTSRVRLDAHGAPISIHTNGNNYTKAPYVEEFQLAGGLARWQNSVEVGEKKSPGRSFYLGMQGMPWELELLAKALLQAPGHRLQLLPEGEARIHRTGEVALRNGEQQRRVTSYEITGLGFEPTVIWLDPDGSLFAFIPWFAAVRAGWEASVPQLLELQMAAQSQRSRELAHSLAHRPKSPLAITNAKLFDAQTGRSVPGTTVVLVGNRIKAVGLDGSVSIPAGAKRIDAHGRALLPGLWDMHTHLGPEDGVLHIAAGVTSVRNMGNDIDELLAIRAQIEAGERIGPRISMAGFMDGRGPYTGPTKVVVDTPAQAEAAIDRYAQLGYGGIKIYSSIKPELVPQIIQLAHAKGLRVGGHVPAFMNARQFIEAGADEIQHITFVFLNFFDDVKDTRTPVRFTAVAERAATLDLSSAPVQSFVRLLQDRKTVIDPTVNVSQAAFSDRPGVMPQRFAPVFNRLPPQVRRGLLEGGFPVPAGMERQYRDASQALLRMIKLLHESGVALVPGSDAMAGFALQRELELYVEAGIAAPEVLRIATIGAARVLKQEHELGSIEPGKLADLLLVDGDPARCISDVRNMSLVIKDGVVFEPAALYASIGVAPAPSKRSHQNEPASPGSQTFNGDRPCH